MLRMRAGAEAFVADTRMSAWLIISFFLGGQRSNSGKEGRGGVKTNGSRGATGSKGGGQKMQDAGPARDKSQQGDDR